MSRLKPSKGELLQDVPYLAARKSGHATVMYMSEDGGRVLRYRRHDISKLSADGKVSIRIPRVRKKLAVSRINDFLPKGMRVTSTGRGYRLDFPPGLFAMFESDALLKPSGNGGYRASTDLEVIEVPHVQVFKDENGYLVAIDVEPSEGLFGHRSMCVLDTEGEVVSSGTWAFPLEDARRMGCRMDMGDLDVLSRVAIAKAFAAESDRLSAEDDDYDI